MAQLAEDVDRLPIPNPVNKPASGTHGDKAELQRLEDSLPDPTDEAAGPELPPIDPTGVRNVRSNRNAPGLPGVPRPLLAPTNRPNVPVNTPLRRGGGPAQQTSAQRNLAIVDMLANSPDVSEDTREWARLMLTLLTQA